ncbi:MAG: DUF817 domain-containing protein [Candidatus Magasanikbacteria bacterium]|nr:DUF817 domain-containing protein [Candidatus Magasanikbacteria bacterium]
MSFYLREFFVFGLKQARACIFAGSFFLLLFLSHHIHIPGLARYDFLFLAAVAIQIILYLTKIETKDEVKMICLFHVIGLILEIYKTNPAIGSWSYPEVGYFKIANVPLYSGFMYAAVGSYISQAWNIFKLELTGYKNYTPSIVLSILIYLNFFTNHFLPDFRWVLFGLVAVVFAKTIVQFTITIRRYAMPLIISFVLIGFFIWIAENISTYFGAWKYPDQLITWTSVSTRKITSWALLVIISFIIVAYLKHFKKQKRPLGGTYD